MQSDPVSVVGFWKGFSCVTKPAYDGITRNICLFTQVLLNKNIADSIYPTYL
jgi:hypothetical protein